LTSISNEYWIEEGKRSAEKAARAKKWLNDNDLQSLEEWLDLKKIEFYDLVDLDLLTFSEQLNPVSLPQHIASLSELGSQFIGVIPEYLSRESGNLFWSGFESHHGYLIEKDVLDSMIVNQTQKSKPDRARKYVDICAKYGIATELAELYAPFEESRFIAGPYCDLLQRTDNNDAARGYTESFCQLCGCCISEKPRFQLSDDFLCFRCSKLVVARLEHMARSMNKSSLTAVEESIRTHHRWKAKFQSKLFRKPISVMLAELFGANQDDYRQSLLQEFPEPSELEYLPKAPALKIVDNPFDGTTVSRNWVLKRDKENCQLCGVGPEFGSLGKLEAHHIVPKAAGGANVATNMITLCTQCHDHESWFGHKRAYKTTDEGHGLPVEWEYEIVPELLNASRDKLAAIEDLFEPEVDWVLKAKLQFSSSYGLSERILSQLERQNARRQTELRKRVY